MVNRIITDPEEWLRILVGLAKDFKIIAFSLSKQVIKVIGDQNILIHY